MVKTGQEYANTDYLTGFQYRSSYTQAQGDLGIAVLQYFPMAEGYVQQKEGRYFYVYHYTDHLGNIRLSYSLDPETQMIKIMEENHYYPFGLKHEFYNTQVLRYVSEESTTDPIIALEIMANSVGDGSYNYKYNGKELQDELGLNMYDYGARNYDPALGRWMNIDPLAEQYLNMSTYNYCLNNPMYFVDPDGMRIIDNNGIVSGFISKTKSEIDLAKQWLKNGIIDAEIADKLINFFEGVLSEIESLEKSSQVYNVSYDSSYDENQGGNTYNFETKEVSVGFGKNSNYGLIGHELKHAYQFQMGKISMGSDAILYDITDETEAYNRQLNLVEGQIQYGPARIPNYSDNDIIENFGSEKNNYKKLPKSSLSLKSKEGKNLRKTTIEAGKNKKPPTNFYIGWEKDYNKGLKKSKK